jgi:hypothetical protein
MAKELPNDCDSPSPADVDKYKQKHCERIMARIKRYQCTGSTFLHTVVSAENKSKNTRSNQILIGKILHLDL